MLDTSQIHRLTEFSVSLHEARDLDQLGMLATHALNDMIPCDWPVVSLATTLLPGVRFAFSTRDADWNSFCNDSLAHAHEDPVYTDRLRLLLDGPMSVTAAVGDERQFQRTALYEQVWRPMGIERLARYLTPGTLSYRLEVAREQGEEFTQDELALIHAVGRQLDAATMRLVRANSGYLPLAKGRAPVQLFCWLVCDERGTVLRSSPQAMELMRGCLGVGVSLKRIPKDWLDELQRRSRGEPAQPKRYPLRDRLVSVHIAPIRPTTNEYSVGFLTSPLPVDPLEALTALGLTPRQAEVLRLIAQGKTNAEAAEALGISALTVKKHLENVFHALKVENRTAAVVAAIEAMGPRPQGLGYSRTG